MSSLKVAEKFYSIQGEGGYIGNPSIFVRLMGCPLNCPYCDSKHASRTTENPKYELFDKEDTIKFANKVATAPPEEVPAQMVVITGGEPILYENWYLLKYFVETLVNKHNLKITFETSMIPRIDVIKTQNVADVLGDLFDYFYRTDGSDDGVTLDDIILTICPKLDVSCYPSDLNITLDDIINYYKPNTKEEIDIFYNDGDISYKIVYYNEIEDIILKFIDSFESDIRDYLYIMPKTDINNFSKEGWIESCQKTVDFCKKYALRYSPRVHIDLWDLAKGV